MSLKKSKQSKYLVGLYISELPKDNNLASCLYSIANQTTSVDLVILTNGLSDEDISTVETIATAPFITVQEKGDDGNIASKRIDSAKGANFEIVRLDEPMNFAQLFNHVFNMASDLGYELVSFAEQDDSYSARWFETVDKYSQENPEVGIFAPLIRNTVSGVFAGTMNESSWVEGMAEKAGEFDLNLLQRFNCLSPLGAVYKIQPILEYSEKSEDQNRALPMKESMKLSHYYEFFLRFIYNAVPIVTIPRFGYELRAVNKNSFHDSSCKIPQNLTALSPDNGGVSPDEARYWFEIAKKEFFYDEDRKKAYEPMM